MMVFIYDDKKPLRHHAVRCRKKTATCGTWYHMHTRYLVVGPIKAAAVTPKKL